MIVPGSHHRTYGASAKMKTDEELAALRGNPVEVADVDVSKGIEICPNEGDLLVFNDTKVIPARLAGRRGAAKVEVTLHKAIDAATWRAFARPARRLKKGDRIDFAPDFAAEVETKGEAGEVTLSFETAGADLGAALERFGAIVSSSNDLVDSAASSPDAEHCC